MDSLRRLVTLGFLDSLLSVTMTPAQMLLIAPGHRVWVSADEPAAKQQLLVPLPDGAEFVDALSPEVDVAVLFCKTRADFDAVWLAQSEPLADRPTVWVCYLRDDITDLHRDSLWAALTPYGWRPVSEVVLHVAWMAVSVRPMNSAELAAAEPEAMINGDPAAIAAVLKAAEN